MFFDGLMVVPTARQALALLFPSAPGVIVSSEVQRHSDSERGTTYGVAVTYKYAVSGREYFGRRYRYQNVFTSFTSISDWPAQVVAANPVGAEVAVFYNPAHPADALLAPGGVSGTDLFQLQFMTPFNVVMLSLWSAGWTSLRWRWFRPVAGGVKIVSRSKETRVRLTEYSPLNIAIQTKETRVRLTEYSPLVIAIGMAAVLAFLSLFVIAFGFGGMDPTLHTMLVTWAVILAGSLGAGGWHWFQVLSGKYDFILDEIRGAVELPLTQGRKTRQRIPLSSIESVSVETIVPPKKDSDSEPVPSYAPTLRVSGQPNPTERLVQWRDAEQAEAFVAWLREKLPVKEAKFLAEESGAETV